MSAENISQARRTMLEKAHLASQSGNDVFVHIEGLSPLQVHEVEPIGEDATIATIRCWPNEESKVEVWLVPLGNVRAIQIYDWRG